MEEFVVLRRRTIGGEIVEGKATAQVPRGSYRTFSFVASHGRVFTGYQDSRVGMGSPDLGRYVQSGDRHYDVAKCEHVPVCASYMARG